MPHRYGGKGAAPPCATSKGARCAGGSKGGREPAPRQPHCMTRGRLAEPSNSGSSQPHGHPRNPPPPPPPEMAVVQAVAAPTLLQTSCGASVRSAAQSRKLERNPCGTVRDPQLPEQSAEGRGLQPHSPRGLERSTPTGACSPSPRPEPPAHAPTAAPGAHAGSSYAPAESSTPRPPRQSPSSAPRAPSPDRHAVSDRNSRASFTDAPAPGSPNRLDRPGHLPVGQCLAEVRVPPRCGKLRIRRRLRTSTISPNPAAWCVRRRDRRRRRVAPGQHATVSRKDPPSTPAYRVADATAETRIICASCRGTTRRHRCHRI